MTSLATRAIMTDAMERPAIGSVGWGFSHAEHTARYLYAAGFIRNRRVLDAGTGPGYGAAILKDAGASWVQAVDIDDVSIEQARVRYPLPGLEFLADDCETLGTARGPFDVICSFENIEHLRHPERFLESAARLLADDGVLLCSTPDRDASYAQWVDGKPSNPYHINEWYADEFRQLLSARFESVDLLAQVESLGSVTRKQAVENLSAHLEYLWGNPLARWLRGANRLLGRPSSWPDVRALASTSPGDFPIVSRVLAADFGQPFCHFAVCRSPKR